MGLMPALGIRQRQQDLALLTGAPGSQLAVDARLGALARPGIWPSDVGRGRWVRRARSKKPPKAAVRVGISPR